MEKVFKEMLLKLTNKTNTELLLTEDSLLMDCLSCLSESDQIKFLQSTLGEELLIYLDELYQIRNQYNEHPIDEIFTQLENFKQCCLQILNK